MKTREEIEKEVVNDMATRKFLQDDEVFVIHRSGMFLYFKVNGQMSWCFDPFNGASKFKRYDQARPYVEQINSSPSSGYDKADILKLVVKLERVDVP